MTQIRVFSKDDCPTFWRNSPFLSTYGATVGLTATWLKFADNVSDPTVQSPEVLEAQGTGYVANKNRMVGGVSDTAI